MNMLINSFDSFNIRISSIPNLIVDLNADTMLNASDTLATEGQAVKTWSNAISGNGVASAVQTDVARQPTMQTVDGYRAVKFDGVDDFLDLGTPAELDFQNDDDVTIIIQLGIGTEGALYHKGDFSNRQVGLFFFGGWNPYLFNVQYSGSAVNPANGMVCHYEFNGTTNAFKTYLDNVIVPEATATNTSTTYNSLSTLLGARYNNSEGTDWAFFLNGSIRRVLIFDRVLTEVEKTAVYNELQN